MTSQIRLIKIALTCLILLAFLSTFHFQQLFNDGAQWAFEIFNFQRWLRPYGTAQIAAEFMEKNHMKKMRVVQNPANIGLGGSHKLIFDYAIDQGFYHVTILHGDDQGELAHMAPVLALMKETLLTSFWMGQDFILRPSLRATQRFAFWAKCLSSSFTQGPSLSTVC